MNIRHQLAWRALQTGCKGLGQYGTVFVVGYFYSPETFGRYGLFFAMLALVRLLGDFGLSRATVREVARHTGESTERLALDASIIVQTGMVGFVGLLYGFLSAPLVNPLLESTELTILLGTYGAVFIGVTYWESVLWGRQEYPTLGRWALLVHVVPLAIKTALASSAASITWLLVVDIAAFFIFLSWAVTRVGRYNYSALSHWHALTRDVEFRGRLIRFARYAGTIGLSGLLFFLYTRVDLIILKSAHGFTDVGTLNLAIQIYEVPLFIGTIISSVFLPRLSRLAESSNGPALRRTFWHGAGLIVVLMLVSATTLFIGTGPVVRWLFPEYLATVPLVMLLTPLLVIKGIGQYCSGAFLVGTGRASIMLRTNLIGGIANLTGDLVVVERFGATGVVWVTLIVHSCVLLFTIGYSLLTVRRDASRRPASKECVASS